MMKLRANRNRALSVSGVGFLLGCVFAGVGFRRDYAFLSISLSVSISVSISVSMSVSVSMPVAMSMSVSI